MLLLLRFLSSAIREICSWVFAWLLPQVPRERPRSGAKQRADGASTHVRGADARHGAPGDLETPRRTRDPDVARDTRHRDERHADVSDSFLSHLEQRTQQVKITLANLEAEKVRIEQQIARLQPLVPHYDALLEAERALQDANIPLHAPADESAQPSQPEGEITGGEPQPWQGDPPPAEGHGDDPAHTVWSGT
jgi:hypothetical protein